MRVRNAFPSFRQVGGYGEALTRIKRVFDPNNILSPDMGCSRTWENKAGDQPRKLRWSTPACRLRHFQGALQRIVLSVTLLDVIHLRHLIEQALD